MVLLYATALSRMPVSYTHLAFVVDISCFGVVPTVALDQPNTVCRPDPKIIRSYVILIAVSYTHPRSVSLACSRCCSVKGMYVPIFPPCSCLSSCYRIRSTPDLNFNDAAELSGSRLTMDQAFRNFGRHTGAPVPELFEMAATTPARAIRIDHLTGSLVPGKYADLVVLNEALEVETVLLRGETVK